CSMLPAALRMARATPMTFSAPACFWDSATSLSFAPTSCASFAGSSPASAAAERAVSRTLDVSVVLLMRGHPYGVRTGLETHHSALCSAFAARWRSHLARRSFRRNLSPNEKPEG